MNQLNARGEIQNRTAMDKVDPLFLPLFESVIQDLQRAFGANLHSVYAYGSIAEGRARVGHSDADFLVVLQQPDTGMAEPLEMISKQLQGGFAQLVSKIDLPCVTRHEVLAAENRESLGAYLKILGLPIYGEDLREGLPAFRPSLSMAWAWNGDLRKNIAAAQAVLASHASDSEKQQMIRAVSAQAVRALYMLIAPEAPEWSTEFDEQAARVAAYFPEEADTVDYLATARRCGKPVSEFSQVLEGFTAGLLRHFEAKSGPEARPQAENL